MSNDYFQFKQFRVEQGSAAMKVSTDACIFGAWTPLLPGVKDVLDIGAGTALLSLMLCQRNDHINVDAIEIDVSAARQAVDNVQRSEWSDRVNIIQGDARECAFSKKYDMVICNPPFFQNSLLGSTTERNIARHTLSLSYADLFSIIKKVLLPTGYVAVILPATEHELWEKIVSENCWSIFQRLGIRHSKQSKINRVISLCAANDLHPLQNEELAIYDAPNIYSGMFNTLLSPFYLNM